jgi:uncharacterized protein (DUF2141 family)
MLFFRYEHYNFCRVKLEVRSIIKNLKKNAMAKFVFFLIMLLPLSGFSQDETYTITGRVNVFAREGGVHVFLATNETFNNNRFPGIDTLVFPVNTNKTSIEYTFEKVPPGKYALSCYQDLTGNNKFDKFLLLPFEPWAFTFPNKVRVPPNSTTFRPISCSITA